MGKRKEKEEYERAKKIANNILQEYGPQIGEMVQKMLGDSGRIGELEFNAVAAQIARAYVCLDGRLTKTGLVSPETRFNFLVSLMIFANSLLPKEHHLIFGVFEDPVNSLLSGSVILKDVFIRILNSQPNEFELKHGGVPIFNPPPEGENGTFLVDVINPNEWLEH